MQASIRPVAPFDATIGTTITFSWSGAQVFQNRCIIRDNTTNEVVYDYTVDSFKLEHAIELSEATLVNGNKYDVYITVFDKDGNESDLQSIPTTFLCLTTPVFQFTNCTSGQVLSSSSYTFMMEYAQENGEQLDSWSISIYNSSKILSITSGTQYDVDELAHTFTGFNDATEYYVRGEGQTINGYLLDTGYIPITVTFQFMNIFSLFDVKNLPELGAIFGQANISALEGKLTNNPVFINDEYLDLSNDTLVYDEGFEIVGDFSIVVKAYNITPNVPLLVIHGDDPTECTLTVYYRVRYDSTGTLQGYFELQIQCGVTLSTRLSNYIEDISNSTTQKAMFLVMRSGGLYEIRAAVLDEEV